VRGVEGGPEGQGGWFTGRRANPTGRCGKSTICSRRHCPRPGVGQGISPPSARPRTPGGRPSTRAAGPPALAWDADAACLPPPGLSGRTRGRCIGPWSRSSGPAFGPAFTSFLLSRGPSNRSGGRSCSGTETATECRTPEHAEFRGLWSFNRVRPVSDRRSAGNGSFGGGVMTTRRAKAPPRAIGAHRLRSAEIQVCVQGGPEPDARSGPRASARLVTTERAQNVLYVGRLRRSVGDGKSSSRSAGWCGPRPPGPRTSGLFSGR